MTPTEIVVFTLATIGTAFMLISAIGIIRLPDIYTRMHAAGKAATLGVGCLLLASSIYYGVSWLPRSVMLLSLFFITAPIATTAMARAAYAVSEPEEKFILRHDDLAKPIDSLVDI